MKKTISASLCSAVAIGMCLMGVAVAEEAASANAPSSLQETYGKWSVACKQEGEQQRCRVSQVQVDEKSKKRLFAFELVAANDAKASGLLLLPFGLDLAKGVTLQVDNKALGAAQPFSTCLPAGCLVPLTVEATLLKQLSKGKLLKMNVMPVNGKAITTFSVPLDGFEAAYKRASGLAKS